MVRGHRWTSLTPNDPRSTGGAILHPTRSARVDKSSYEGFSTLTQVIRPNLIHEIKGGYNFMNFRVESIVPHSPQILLRGYSIGEQSNQMHDVDSDVWQARSDWTWLKGRHEIKMGGEAMHNVTCICPWELWMDGGLNATGGPIPANIQDIIRVWNDPSTWNLAALSPISLFWEQSVGNFAFEDPRKVFGAYVQDNWTLSKRFTLNLGLRYDLAIGAMGEDIIVEPFLPEERPIERLRFSPRLGFGYQMFDNTVIRSGFGKYFGELNDNPTHSTKLSAQVIKVVVPNDGRPDFAANPFNGPPPTPEQARVLPGRSLASNIVNPNVDIYKTPYSWQSSIGVQQQLTQTMGAQVDYVYIGKRHDEAGYEGNSSFNLATGAPYPFSDVSRRPYPTFGSVGMRALLASSNQHSIDTSLTKRFSDSWQASATYSLSWLYDRDAVPAIPCFFGPGDFRPCPEGFTVARDIGGEYSLAAGDQRHRGVVNGIWTLPLGFRVSGLYFFGSGERRSVVFGANLRQFGTGTTGRLRPDGSIVPRNSFVGDPVHRVDLRATKQVPIARSVNLEGIFEIFNVFNHANYGSYVTNLSSASFGRPQQQANVAYQPRMLQLGFRVEF
jgi:outer membrane receptor protein involved in Fe transport